MWLACVSQPRPMTAAHDSLGAGLLPDYSVLTPPGAWRQHAVPLMLTLTIPILAPSPHTVFCGDLC